MLHLLSVVLARTQRSGGSWRNSGPIPNFGINSNRFCFNCAEIILNHSDSHLEIWFFKFSSPLCKFRSKKKTPIIRTSIVLNCDAIILDCLVSSSRLWYLLSIRAHLDSSSSPPPPYTLTNFGSKTIIHTLIVFNRAAIIIDHIRLLPDHGEFRSQSGSNQLFFSCIIVL